MILRGRGEVEAKADAWTRIAWSSEQGELPYFLAEPGEPLALLEPPAALVGKVDTRRLESRIGYVRAYAPRLRVLRVTAVAGDAAALARTALQEVDVVAVPALPLDSPEYRALAPLASGRHGPWTRRRLVLPESFDAFLAGLSRKSRSGVRYDAKRLEEALDARVEVVREPADEPIAAIDSIAQTTYQRRLGAGFSLARADVLRVALAHGWARVFLLYDGETPVAFWWCAVHGDTMRLNTTGYLDQYAAQRPGIYLLMRVIEDAIADPALRVLDFGPGRSAYKQHFSNDGYEERNLLLFAPTFRAQRARAIRSGVDVVSAGARRALDASGGTERVKTAWRRRLRS
jgi:CelD/BcsL family acetyltransferase involved in cellulose biosynthesis